MIVLVRHGQANFGGADYDHLSQLGQEQALTTGAALAARGLIPAVLLQGGMRRHDQTTRGLVEGARWRDTEVITTPLWDEIDHLGVMATFGESPAQRDARAFQVAYERALRRWMSDTSAAPEQESFADFTARVAQGLSSAAQHAGPGRTAVVVTSAGPIGVVGALLMQPDFRRTDPDAWLRWNSVAVNCAITHVLAGRQGTSLLSFNSHAHLSPSAVTYR